MQRAMYRKDYCMKCLSYKTEGIKYGFLDEYWSNSKKKSSSSIRPSSWPMRSKSRTSLNAIPVPTFYNTIQMASSSPKKVCLTFKVSRRKRNPHPSFFKWCVIFPLLSSYSWLMLKRHTQLKKKSSMENPRCQLSETSPSAELRARQNFKMAETQFEKKHIK